MEDKLVTMTIKVSKEDHKRFKLYAVEKGVTFKELFINHMNQLINVEKARKK